MSTHRKNPGAAYFEPGMEVLFFKPQGWKKGPRNGATGIVLEVAGTGDEAYVQWEDGSKRPVPTACLATTGNVARNPKYVKKNAQNGVKSSDTSLRRTYWLYDPLYKDRIVTGVMGRAGLSDAEVREIALHDFEVAPRVGLEPGQVPFEHESAIRRSYIVRKNPTRCPCGKIVSARPEFGLHWGYCKACSKKAPSAGYKPKEVKTIHGEKFYKIPGTEKNPASWWAGFPASGGIVVRHSKPTSGAGIYWGPFWSKGEAESYLNDIMHEDAFAESVSGKFRENKAANWHVTLVEPDRGDARRQYRTIPFGPDIQARLFYKAFAKAGPRGGRKWVVQSLLFPKARYSAKKAAAWAKAHGYKWLRVEG